MLTSLTLALLAALSPQENCSPPDVLIRGSFGYLTVEYVAFGTFLTLQDVRRDTNDEFVPEWSDALSGRTISQRHPYGPPAGAGDIHLDGYIDQSLSFDGQHFRYSIPLHDFCYNGLCGVESHSFGTQADFRIFVRGAAGTPYSITGQASISESLSGPDNSFNYDFAFLSAQAGGVGQLDVVSNASTELNISGETIQQAIMYQGVEYRYAANFSVGGGQGFSVSQIIGCPDVPWHCSVANLDIEFDVLKLDSSNGAFEVELQRVDDENPLRPTVMFELRGGRADIDWSFGGVQQGIWLNVMPGIHPLEIPDLSGIEPGVYPLVVTATDYVDGCSSDEATLDTSFKEVAVSDKLTTFYILNIGTRFGRKRLEVDVFNHAWDVDGGRYDIRVAPSGIIGNSPSVRAKVTAATQHTNIESDTHAVIGLRARGFDDDFSWTNASRGVPHMCDTITPQQQGAFCDSGGLNFEGFGTSGISRIDAHFLILTDTGSGVVPWGTIPPSLSIGL